MLQDNIPLLNFVQNFEIRNYLLHLGTQTDCSISDSLTLICDSFPILKVCHLSFLKVEGGSSYGLNVQISLVLKKFLNVYQQYI